MERPIGIFDSGLGGLTVARAVAQALPRERLIYLGDTARVPYGTRSPQTVVRYARACAAKLLELDIKLLVVACNTASAVALNDLRAEFGIPVLGVIEPGARAAVKATRSGRVGVLSTPGTSRSGAYPRALKAEDPSVVVVSHPAPLLVPLAEEGWLTGEVPRLAAERYFDPLVQAKVDTVLLGCTHYPLFWNVLLEVANKALGPDVTLVDSAVATAKELGTLLDERKLRRMDQAADGSLDLLVTDLPDQFADVASRFLGQPVEGMRVEQVDLTPC